jgi:hypothetical protein
MQGQVMARATPNVVNRLMASNSVSSMPALNKTAMFGSTTTNAQKFSYASAEKIVGGKRKAPSKTKKASQKK